MQSVSVDFGDFYNKFYYRHYAKLIKRLGDCNMQSNKQIKVKKPLFAKKIEKSELFKEMHFQLKLSLITGLSLLIMMGLYNLALWLGLA